MNQRTHTWIAIRAVALLEDEGSCPKLVKLLKPHVKAAAIGTWLPDQSDAKSGGSRTENHVFKLEPFSHRLKSRFVVRKKDLLKQIGPARAVYLFLKEDTTLDSAWWSGSYKANPPPRPHLANRAKALCVTITDMLILGDDEIGDLVPGTISFADQLHADARTRSEQVATYFFMLSHFMADCCMPCHCDARKLAGYSRGLHKELEKHWGKKIDGFFKKKMIAATVDDDTAIVQRARDVDPAFDLRFKNVVPAIIASDTWAEVVSICRASFALASIISPPALYPYGGEETSPFEDLFSPKPSQALLADIDHVAMHDAVLNTAIAWKHIWKKFHA